MNTQSYARISNAFSTSLLLLVALAAPQLTPVASAAEKIEKKESIFEFLSAFHKNPTVMMQRLPSRVDKNGDAHPRGFIRDNIPDWEKIIQFRDRERSMLMQSATSAPSEGQDRPEILVEPGTALKNISDMQNRGLSQALISPVPWADSYWPTYKGQIAHRYGDTRSPNNRNWKENLDYSNQDIASAVMARGIRAEINLLSPAEKYDLIMGDANFSLTSYSWRQGQGLYEQYGAVPTWMGICHGWAGAAHMEMTYPAAPIDILAPNGTPITFYPQDVKALQSMLWANAAPPVRFAGNRCSISRPARNANGRIIDKGCFDVSPSTWHVGVVTQAGLNHRSFVMDGTYDLEVWNFPIVSYRYRYFNPQTWAEGTNLSAAIVPLDKFKVDKFRSFRSAGTVSVVGVAMDITYITEINPTQRSNDVPPPQVTVRYMYDLELDGAQNILGGEWYSNAHPDFLWTYDRSLSAKVKEDAQASLTPWNGSSQVPGDWAGLARSASSRGAPLQTFLSRLPR